MKSSKWKILVAVVFRGRMGLWCMKVVSEEQICQYCVLVILSGGFVGHVVFWNLLITLSWKLLCLSPGQYDYPLMEHEWIMIFTGWWPYLYLDHQVHKIRYSNYCGFEIPFFWLGENNPSFFFRTFNFYCPKPDKALLQTVSKSKFIKKSTVQTLPLVIKVFINFYN